MANKTIKIDAIETETPKDKATELTTDEMQNVQGGYWTINQRTGRRVWVDDGNIGTRTGNPGQFFY
jgi:bacteriocin-like protein